MIPHGNHLVSRLNRFHLVTTWLSASTPHGGDAHPFDRLLSKGEVTDDDLALATDQFTAGQLTRRQYERIYAAWVDGAADAPGTEGGDEDGQSTTRSE